MFQSLLFLLLPGLFSSLPTLNREYRKLPSFAPKLNFPMVKTQRSEKVRDDDFIGLFTPDDVPEFNFESFIIDCFICQDGSKKEQYFTPIEDDPGKS